MLTKYAKSLIERKAAIDGTVKRHVAIAHDKDQAKLSVYAGSLVARLDNRLSNRKVRVEWGTQSRFTIALRDAGNMLRNRDATKAVTIKTTKITWLARIRNRFTGKVKTLRIRSVSHEQAKRKAAQSIRKFEALLDVTEKRFAIQ